MSMRSSSLANNPLAITRELDGRYDVVLQVRDNLDLIEQVAGVDFEAIIAELEAAQDFTGITVMQGETVAWDAVNKVLTVPKGDKGDKGDTGLTGLTGPQGIQGPQGIKGDTGLKGDTGSQGPKGFDGEDGVQGPKGDTGADLTITQITYNGNGTFNWLFSDGTSYTTPDLRGPKGDVGSQGVKGDQGISVHHIKGTSTTDSEGDFGSFGEIDTYTVYGDAAETINLGYFRVNNGLAKDNQHSIMYGSTYDTNGNGVVDNSERLEGKTLYEVQDFSNIHGKPTTLSGYGISDAFTKAEVTNNISNAIAGLVNGAPAVLDTLGELSAALANDANFATTIANSIGDKVTKNTAIVSGTNTQITYDSKGLITGGTTPTTLAGYSINDAYTKIEGDNRYESKNANIQNHIASTSNPHGVTKTQVGLGNVDNTADNTKNVLSATKWTTARTLSLTGDVTGSSSIDGSANANITMTLANSGVTAGTYSNVTVDGKGRVTAATNPTTIAGFGITDAYTKTEVLGSFGMLSSPLLDLPLKNSLSMKAGVGSTTFTRASTATYIDRYGVLKTAAIDEPRFEKEGYLNEGERTNLLTYSELFSGSSWIKSNITVTAGQSDPMGGTNAFMWDETTAIATSYLYRNITFTAQSYSASLFVKKGTASEIFIWFNNALFSEGQQAHIRFNFVTKVITDVNNSVTSEKVEELANGWFRVSFSFTVVNAQTTTGFVTGAQETNNTGNTFYIFGAQLEALPFATSYIPTTTSTVTRSADVLQVTRENNFPNAENNAQGYSVAFAYDSLGIRSANQFLWSLYASGQNYVGSYLATTTNSLRNVVVKDNVAFHNSIIPQKPLGNNKVVQTQSNTFLKQYINGALVDTDVNTLGTLGGGVNSLTNITVGGISGISTSNLFGHISDFKVYDRELTPVEVTLL